MLWNEFENAYLSVNQNNPRVTLPLNCSASVRQAIQAVYTSRKGDNLFTGSDRHRTCALWVRDNQATVARLARWIGRREKISRCKQLKAYADNLYLDVMDGRRGLANAALLMKCATNLTLGEF